MPRSSTTPLRTALLFLLATGPLPCLAQSSNDPSTTSQTAPEGEPAEPDTPSGPAAATDSLGHRNQFGVAARFGSGYRMVIPYNEENCGELDESGDPKSVCRARYPFWVEISPSYGLTDALELLVDLRLFLESPNFTDATGLFIAPGFKYYTDELEQLKFYLTGQLVFELQDQSRENSDLSNFDFGLRSVMGMQVDLLRYVGLFLQGGVVFGFSRWFSFLADLSGGIQVRY